MSFPKNRIELARYFHDLGYKVGAEVGVADGRYSEILLENINNLKLHLVDPWAKYEGNWRTDDYQEKAYQQAVNRLERFGSQAKFYRDTSLNASIEVPDKSLDFVFIDGAHDFDNVMLDILLWSKKVRKGGIVSGHDYYQFTNSGVIEAVNAYVEKHNISLNVTLLDHDAHKDDQCPCWWFTKK